MPQNKFYQYGNFFTLTAYGDAFDINEPVGWDGVHVNLNRDRAKYGFNKEYADATVNLQFWDKDGGAEFIRSVYEQYGGDGIIVLTYGDIISGNRVTQYTGTLNLNEYDRVPDKRFDDRYYIACPVEKQSFDSKYRSRYETQITLTDTKNLDGGDITPPTPLNITLISKEIIRQAEYKSATPEDPNAVVIDANPNDQNEVYYSPDLTTGIKTELTTFSGGTAGILDNNPADDHIWQYKPDEDGVFDLTYTDTFYYSAVNTGNNSHSTIFEPYVRQYRNGLLIEEYFPAELKTSVQGNNPNFQYSIPGTLTKTLSVLQNDEIYIGIKIHIDDNDQVFATIQISNLTSHITASQATTQPASTAMFYKLINAYKYCVESATGVANVVTAPVFETGCFSKYALTNGYAVRQYPGSYPYHTTLKEREENMQALFNVGFGYQGTGFNDSRIFIAPMMTFFSGARIAILQPIYGTYDEAHDKAMQFNEAVFGFNKYSDSSENTLDDFSSYRETLLPLTTFKAKKEIKASDIASGFLFEEARREQFKSSPSTSLANDDDTFILNYDDSNAPIVPRLTQDFTSVTGIFSPGTTYNLNITPEQIQYNWAPFFNIGLYVKLATDVIKTTFVKQGKNLVRTYDSSQPCYSDMPATPLAESADIALADYKFGNRPHTPRKVTFKAYLTWDELNTITVRLRGESNTDQDFGFITVPDDAGVLQDVHVYDMEHEPASGICKLTCYIIGVAANLPALLNDDNSYLLNDNRSRILL